MQSIAWKRLVSEMTYYVSSWTLNPTHSLTHSAVFCTTVVHTHISSS